MARIILKDKGLKSIARRHPWIFSGAVARVEGGPASGDTVEVISPGGDLLALAAYSPQSQIIARVWDFIGNSPGHTDFSAFPSANFFEGRISRALALRSCLGFLPESSDPREKEGICGIALPPDFNEACRVINSESDGLPGLIADLYGEFLVCQFLSAGAESHKNTLASALARAFPKSMGQIARKNAHSCAPSAPLAGIEGETRLAGIFERSDTDSRTKEGLKASTGPLAGVSPPDLIEISEDGRRYLVDIANGHKTGFYLDQRENRSIVESMAAGRRVLNCFSYTGGFGIAAMAGGAESVTSIDTSAPALEIAARASELNAGSRELEWICGDAFKILREFASSGRRFDLVVLDPPKFASSAAQVNRACRGYKDINRLAFSLLDPGGILVTFSCSGLMAPDLFGKVVSDAALDAGREAVITNRLFQSPDHAVSLPFPEGLYLKGFVCMVTGIQA